MISNAWVDDAKSNLIQHATELSGLVRVDAIGRNYDLALDTLALSRAEQETGHLIGMIGTLSNLTHEVPLETAQQDQMLFRFDTEAYVRKTSATIDGATKADVADIEGYATESRAVYKAEQEAISTDVINAEEYAGRITVANAQSATTHTIADTNYDVDINVAGVRAGYIGQLSVIERDITLAEGNVEVANILASGVLKNNAIVTEATKDAVYTRLAGNSEATNRRAVGAIETGSIIDLGAISTQSILTASGIEVSGIDSMATIESASIINISNSNVESITITASADAGNIANLSSIEVSSISNSAAVDAAAITGISDSNVNAITALGNAEITAREVGIDNEQTLEETTITTESEIRLTAIQAEQTTTIASLEQTGLDDRNAIANESQEKIQFERADAQLSRTFDVLKTATEISGITSKTASEKTAIELRTGVEITNARTVASLENAGKQDRSSQLVSHRNLITQTEIESHRNESIANEAHKRTVADLDLIGSKSSHAIKMGAITSESDISITGAESLSTLKILGIEHESSQRIIAMNNRTIAQIESETAVSIETVATMNETNAIEIESVRDIRDQEIAMREAESATTTAFMTSTADTTYDVTTQLVDEKYTVAIDTLKEQIDVSKAINDYANEVDTITAANAVNAELVKAVATKERIHHTYNINGGRDASPEIAYAVGPTLEDINPITTYDDYTPVTIDIPAKPVIAPTEPSFI